jgi:hypothetical protein
MVIAGKKYRSLLQSDRQFKLDHMLKNSSLELKTLFYEIWENSFLEDIKLINDDLINIWV